MLATGRTKIKNIFFVKKTLIYFTLQKNIFENVSTIKFYKNIFYNVKYTIFDRKCVLNFFALISSTRKNRYLLDLRKKIECKQILRTHCLYEQNNMWKVQVSYVSPCTESCFYWIKFDVSAISKQNYICFCYPVQYFFSGRGVSGDH